MAVKVCKAEGCGGTMRARGFCGAHYQKWRTYGDPLYHYTPPLRVWATCSIEGCTHKSRSVRGRLCEAHYYRRYRTGSFDGPAYKRRYLATNGYVLMSGVRGHPMVSPSGNIYEHRKVLFDEIGTGKHQCHWCGLTVEWAGKGTDRLVVDHLDSNKANNAVSNLVPSCHKCNATRGLFMNWVMKHRDDPFLAEMFDGIKQAAERGGRV